MDAIDAEDPCEQVQATGSPLVRQFNVHAITALARDVLCSYYLRANLDQFSHSRKNCFVYVHGPPLENVRTARTSVLPSRRSVNPICCGSVILSGCVQ